VRFGEVAEAPVGGASADHRAAICLPRSLVRWLGNEKGCQKAQIDA
jgi:hypothetical protein